MTRHADNSPFFFFFERYHSVSVHSFACSSCIVSQVVKTNSAVAELYIVIFEKKDYVTKCGTSRCV